MHASLALLALLPTTFAHFVLNYPSSLGFSDGDQGTAPCGGFDIVFNSTTDTNITVGGFAVAARSTHPQSNWLYRATLSIEEPFNWTNILPVVSQSGLGDFCLPTLTLPAEFAGKSGIIQVSQSAVDGNLYQCAAVNFVEGVNSTVGAGCTNATGITAQVTSETSLGNEAASESASATSASATSAPSGAGTREIVGGLLAIVPVAFLLL